MASGKWSTQNKVRPGAYINFKTTNQNTITIGERGVVAMPMIMSWAGEEKIIEINSQYDLRILGFDETDESFFLAKEALKRAKKLLIYRLNKGTKATAALEGITINAIYSGIKGNDISIVIQNSIVMKDAFDIITLLKNKEVDRQTVKSIKDFKTNNFIEIVGEGELKVTAGLPLFNGSDGITTNEDYMKALSTMELYDFNVLAITSKEQSIKAMVTNFIKRLREEEGKNVQAVLENYKEADYEGIISVKNGVILDGVKVTSDKAVAWVAGATAGAYVNESLTYSTYEGAIDVDNRYTNKEIENALKDGEIIFTISNGKVVVEQDINTLSSVTQNKSQAFRKNRVIRTLDSIGNDIKLLWESRYVGKMDNNENGRNLFKKDIMNQMVLLEKVNAIENVTVEDVEVIVGNTTDSVIVNMAVKPVDSMEKLYMTVEVE